MMYIVYCLYSAGYGKIYIGFTSNLEARLSSHNGLSAKGYTARYRPWEVIHQEKFDTKAEAMTREKQLKSAKGRQFVWSLVQAE